MAHVFSSVYFFCSLSFECNQWFEIHRSLWNTNESGLSCRRERYRVDNRPAIESDCLVTAGTYGVCCLGIKVVMEMTIELKNSQLWNKGILR